MLEKRKAEIDDCKILFEWANNEEVRKNAFSQNKIDYKEHIKWFNNKIGSKVSWIFICSKNELPIGQFRIDKENDFGIIGYSVDRKYRGLGYGTQILQIIKEMYIDNEFDVEYLVGKVKPNNVSSIKAFERAGYKKYIENESFIEYRCCKEVR